MAESQPPIARTLYFGTFINTPTPKDLEIRHGALWVSGSGEIEGMDWDVNSPEEWVQKMGWKDEETKIVRSARMGFFFPGFIDTHIHAPQYPNAGIFGTSTLLSWLQTYTFPLEASFTNLSKAGQIYTRVIDRTFAHGTTCASYYATTHVPATNLLADLCLSKGQRAFIGRVCMDNPETCPDYYRDSSPETAMTDTLASISHIRSIDPSGTLVAPILTPRFAPSCTPQTLTSLGALAKKENLRIQTHISENLSELDLVKSLFPLHVSYTHVYEAYSLLTQRTILAHAVHLSPQERALIKTREAKISHCPTSNSALGSGLCPVRTLVDEGITVGLGTDMSGGFSPNILETVRQACLVSRHVEYRDRDPRANVQFVEGLYLATRGGARLVGLEGRIGAFERGMCWDAQLIGLGEVSEDGGQACEGWDAGNVDVFGWESWEERVAKWVWGGDDRNVRAVWVGGRLVHERKG